MKGRQGDLKRGTAEKMSLEGRATRGSTDRGWFGSGEGLG